MIEYKNEMGEPKSNETRTDLQSTTISPSTLPRRKHASRTQTFAIPSLKPGRPDQLPSGMNDSAYEKRSEQATNRPPRATLLADDIVISVCPLSRDFNNQFCRSANNCFVLVFDFSNVNAIISVAG